MIRPARCIVVSLFAFCATEGVSRSDFHLQQVGLAAPSRRLLETAPTVGSIRPTVTAHARITAAGFADPERQPVPTTGTFTTFQVDSRPIYATQYTK